MFRRACLLIVPSVAIFMNSVRAQPPGQFSQVGEEIINAVRDQFFDEQWAQAWVRKHRVGSKNSA